MAKGMKNAPFANKVSWQAVQQMPIDELSQKLQGSLSQATLIEKLQFADSIPPEKQQWIKNWFEMASDELIKQFIYSITGATAVGAGVIKIKDNSTSKNLPLVFQTCFNLVAIPFAKISSESEFKAIFEAALVETKRFNRS